MAEFIVDSLDDRRDASDGVTTLREAVEAANAAAGADVVTFSVAGVIRLDAALGAIEVRETLEIDGGDAITLDGGGATRILAVPEAEDPLSLVDLALRDGNGAGAAGGGGAVFAAGALRLERVTATGNATTADDAPGGAVHAGGDLVLIDTVLRANATAGANAKGGAAFAGGTLTVSGGEIADNTTTGLYAGGGGVHAAGRIEIADALLSGNATSGRSAGGGAVSGEGAVVLSGATLTANATYGDASNGGGVYAAGDLAATDSTFGGREPGEGNRTLGENAVGGGLATRGQAELAGVSILGNRTEGAGANGGGLYGAGAVTIGESAARGSLVSLNATAGDGAQGGGVFARGRLEVSDTTVAGNETDGLAASGGGLHGAASVSLRDGTLSGNLTRGDNAPGGGVHAGGDLAIEAVYVARNQTSGADAPGGAAAAAGDLSVALSTVQGNATYGANATGGALSASGAVTLSDISLTANRTEGADARGGAVFAGGALSVSAATVTLNGTEARGASGGALATDGAARIAETRLADNTTLGTGATGGAVEARAGLVLAGATFSDNRTSGTEAAGGAVHVAGPLTAAASTFTGNRTDGRDAPGGAILARDAATLAQATLAGNSTGGGASSGGGIAALGDLALLQSTVTGNIAFAGGSIGGGIFSTGALEIANALVLGNAAAASADPDRQDIATGDGHAGRTDLGPALDGPDAPPAEAIFAETVALADGSGRRAGVAAEAGGARPVVALLADGQNPALDTGDAALLGEAATGRDLDGDGRIAGALAEDARGAGFARVIDIPSAPGAGGVDLGAMELGTLARPPEATDDAARLEEGDGPLTLAPLANDTAGPGGALTIAALETDGLAGTATLGEDGATVIYEPAADVFDDLARGEEVVETFAYRVTDPTGATARAGITVTLVAANSPPVPAPDSATVPANGSVTVDVLANDTDPDPDDVLEIAALSTFGTAGTVEVAPDGRSVIYDPDGAFDDLFAGDSATDTLGYVVSDGLGGAAQGTLTVTVTGVIARPAPPVAQPDLVTATPGAVVILDPLADNGAGPDTDPNGDAIAVSELGPTGSGEAVLLDDGRVIYRAAPGAEGTDSFDYTLADATGATDAATVTVEIEAEADPGGLTRAEAQRVAYLFDAALDRTGQAAGVNFWIDQREEGLSQADIALEFLTAPEFEARVGTLDDLGPRGLVEALFETLLGRPGQAAGIDHWTGRIESGALRPEEVLIAFADATELLPRAPEVATLFEVNEGTWAFA